MSINWFYDKSYIQEPIHVLESHSRVYGVRDTPPIYYNSRYTKEVVVTWETYLPDSCYSSLSISFDGGVSWRDLKFNKTIPITDTKGVSYFIIRVRLEITKMFLLSPDNYPSLKWIRVVDTYEPSSCSSRITLNVLGERFLCIVGDNGDLSVGLDKDKSFIME